MQRDQETPVEGLIELGQASVETRGPPGIYTEVSGYADKPLGLSD